MKDLHSYIAENRFGLGSHYDADPAGSDPRGWLLAQIGPVDPGPLARFRPSADILAELLAARATGPETLRPVVRTAYRRDYAAEVLVRAQHMIDTRTPFAERMLLFWSNHFTVSNAKRIIGPALPAYEREVIRPHVFGRFSDMLIAVCRHPVMLSYLDNFASIGEGSAVGRRQTARTGTQKTLNENLAREILELHTLGVDGGYSQQDVIELARAISGWSHGGLRRGRDRRPIHGGFEFRESFHEPGAKKVLGKTYRSDGPQQGVSILRDLARHPATATHIASKLARHFVADVPPPPVVEHLARVFLDTDGDLAALAAAVVELDAVWVAPLPKIKTHYEYVIATHRAVGTSGLHRDQLFKPLGELGQVPFTAPSPAGWGDTASDWLAPESLMRRIEWVRSAAGTFPRTIDPVQFLEGTVGPVAGDQTRLWLSRAPAIDAALALVLSSPEFQRR